MSRASEVKVLIAVGFGLNCEGESEWAWRRAGATVRRAHLADLFQDPSPLEEAHIFMLIGGFAYGDHIASGRVLATRLRYRLGKELDRFVESGKLVLGVCNGFQTLVKTGLLPAIDGPTDPQRVSLAENIPAKFYDAWVRLAVDPDSPCIYTQGLKQLDLPVRHGEGRFVAESQWLFDRLQQQHLFPLAYADPLSGKPTEAYPANPNRSPGGVAGLCDRTGRVFGLMPHPEAALVATSHPHWTRFRAGGFFDPDANGDGQAIFDNAVAFAIDHLI